MKMTAESLSPSGGMLSVNFFVDTILTLLFGLTKLWKMAMSFLPGES